VDGILKISISATWLNLLIEDVVGTASLIEDAVGKNLLKEDAGCKKKMQVDFSKKLTPKN
jgi:hypothetical protein